MLVVGGWRWVGGGVMCWWGVEGGGMEVLNQYWVVSLLKAELPEYKTNAHRT